MIEEKSMGKIRKIVSWVLIVTLIIPIIVFTIPDVSAKADSNDRRNVFLRLSQGKNLSTFTKDEIDEETMRILALYITNFYNLGDMDLYSLSKNENSEDALKLFQTALEAASLDPKTAEMMVPYLLETSVKSNQMLYITEEDSWRKHSNW